MSGARYLLLMVGLALCACVAPAPAYASTQPGSVLAWGANTNGELGDGTVITTGCYCISTPAPVESVGGTGALAGVTAIAAGDQHSLALLSDGTVVAWGDNSYGELGNRSVVTGSSATPVPVQGVGGKGTLSNVVAIAAGRGYSLALLSDRTVVAWGQDDVGQEGDGNTTGSVWPVRVRGIGGKGTLSNVVAIAAGARSYHSLALLSDGSVVAWGDNYWGQLGDGTTTRPSTGCECIPTPVRVRGVGGAGTLSRVVAIATGGSHSLALLSDGSVVAWGLNSEGQLGDGTFSSASAGCGCGPTPVRVAGVAGAGTLSGVAAIAAGTYDSLARLSDGTVAAWGDNSWGDLGDGTTTSRSTPVPVIGPDDVGTLSKVVAIAAGPVFDLALRSDGSVVGWGYNQDGELGDGTTTGSSAPVLVSGLSRVDAIAAGGFGGLAGIASGRPPASCRIQSSRTVTAAGLLSIGVRCDQAASVRLKATLTVAGKAFTLAPVTARVRRGATRSVALKIPGRALSNLRRKRKAAVVLTLTATNRNGATRAIVTIRGLKAGR